MKASYEKETDVLGFSFSSGQPERVEVIESEQGVIFLEFGSEGQLMGIEIIGAKQLIPQLLDFLSSFKEGSLSTYSREDRERIPAMTS